MVCNPMSCAGFGTDVLGGCSMVWIAAVILFFIIILARRWIGEEAGIPFNIFWAFALGFLAFTLAAIFTCSHKWALVAGMIGAAVGALLAGQFLEN